jgi:hypothetical protein
VTALDFYAQFSAHRLGGEPLPGDFLVLFEHRHELLERTGVELNGSVDWTPWLDTSYLTAEDWGKPDICANVRAMAEVCRLSAFVAAHEDRNYFGYWRGPRVLQIEHSLPMWLDNEGRLDLCGTSNIAGAILAYACGSARFDEVRTWFHSLGIGSLPSSHDDLTDPYVELSPSVLHEELYRRYLANPGAA